MASSGGYFRNDSWKEDTHLKDDLKKYVNQLLKRNEILSYMQRDYPHYTWSIRSLDRRLRHFSIYYTDTTVTLEEVKDAVKEELDGPGKLLGYRAMHKKIRQQHDLNVTRDLVHDVMLELDPEGLQNRSVVQKKKKPKGYSPPRVPISCTLLMVMINSWVIKTTLFPWLFMGAYIHVAENCFGRWYLEHIYETMCIPAYLRMDKGTKTGVRATMHAFLRRHHSDLDDPIDSVIYGPSTSNQIVRWWRELHERLEKYFKEYLSWLKGQRYYDPHNDTDRRQFLLNVKSHLAEGKYHETIPNTPRVMALLLRCEYGENALTSSKQHVLNTWAQANDARALERLRMEDALMKGVSSREAERLLMQLVEESPLHGAATFPAISSIGEEVVVAVCRDGVRMYGQGMAMIDEHLFSDAFCASLKGKQYTLEIGESFHGYKVTFKLPTNESARNIYHATVEMYSFFYLDSVGDWVLHATRKRSRLDSLSNLIQSPKASPANPRYVFDVERTENEVYELAWRAIAEQKAAQLQSELRPSLPPALPKTPRALGQVFQFSSPSTPLTAKNRLLEATRMRLASGYLTRDRLMTNQTFNGFFSTVSCMNPKQDLSLSANSEQSESNKSVFSGLQEFSRTASELREMYSVKKQKQTLKSAMCCKVCEKRWKNSTYLPCLHTEACIECALKSMTCGVCDTVVTRVTRNSFP